MMIFKKCIARRSFLQGAGATVALPLLDAMIPALAGPNNLAAQSPVRLSIVFVPNGRIMNHWTPKDVGNSFILPKTLESLAPYQDQLLVLSGLSSMPERDLIRSELGVDAGPHATASGIFLTGAYPRPGGLAGISVDQIAAKETSKHTQLSSLELTLDSGEMGAGADGADSDAYLNTFSWRSESTPLPVENNPRKVFERLFGEMDSTDPVTLRQRIQEDRSILDIVNQEITRLEKSLGHADRAKLSEYLDGIRDVERRIQIAEKTSTRELPVMQRPAGLVDNYEEHARLMFDLQILAFQTDMTRVTTLAMAKEKSERAYREIGLEEGHHALTHHGYNPVMMDKCVRLESYQTKQFAYYLDKMQNTIDGDGSLLDHSITMFSSSLSDGHKHSRSNLPVVLAGGGAGKINGGRHIRYADNTPLTNLCVSMLDICGVEVDQFGDSTGQLDLNPSA
ncbi:MAG: hypothetical protein ACI9XC_000541 [Gammaproteobacteria bacterium]|jgi:hypothetical protein